MRRILLLFVLLCFGTYLSAQTLSAHYAVDSAELCYPQRTVHFTDQSTGQVKSWYWKFGDGTFSTEQNPTHTFTNRGKYVVSLVVTDVNGNIDSTTESGNSKAINIYPFIDFGIPSLYAACGAVQLSNQGYADATGIFPATYLWSTGSTASAITANSAYAIYKLTLNQCGMTVKDSITFTKSYWALTIGDPVVNFYNLNSDSLKIDWGALTPFPSGTKYKVDWGAGATADTLKETNYVWYKGADVLGKNLNVTFRATIPKGWGTGCDTVVTGTRTMPATYLKFDSWNGKDTTILYGDTLRLTSVNTLATATWTLPDDNQEIDKSNPVLITKDSGLYVVDMQYGNEIVRETIRVKLKPHCSEDFKVTLTNLGDKTFVMSPSSSYSYKWYRNGVLMPNVDYFIYPPTEAYYAVEVTNATGCVARDTMLWAVVYDATATFTNATPVIACDSSKWKFKADFGYYKKADSIQSWKFDYGDGISGMDSIHQYTAPGTYHVIVNLRTYSSMGASDTVTVTVRMPSVVTAEKVSGIQDTIFAHPPVGYDRSLFTVSWSRDGIALPGNSWFIVPDDAGTYTVSVSSQHNCESSASVIYAPGAGFNYKSVNCDPQTISCTFVGATDSIQAYKWTLNGKIVSAEKNPVLALDSGVNILRVTATFTTGDTASVAKYINAEGWTLRAAIGTIADCNVSAILDATTNAPAGKYFISWNKGRTYKEGMVIADSSDTYIVTLKDTCGNIRAIDSVHLVLDQVKQPAIFQAGDTLQVLSANLNYTYSWFRNDTLVGTGTTAPYPTKSGIYKVKAFKTDSCYKTSLPLTYIAPGEKLAYSISKLPAACGLNTYDFTVTPSLPYGDSVVSYYWVAGKDTSRTNRLTVKLLEGGLIQAQLTITTAYGLTTTVNESQEVVPLSLKVNNNGINPCRDTAYLSTIVSASTPYKVVWNNSFVGNSYTAITSGTYYVSLQDSCGKAYLQDSITVNLTPFTPVIRINATIDTIFCTPNDTTVYTYMWNMGAVPVGVGNKSYLTDLQNGAIYGVTVRDTGCSKYSNTIAVTKKLIASFTITPSACDSSVVTLAGSYSELAPGDTIRNIIYNFEDGSYSRSQNLVKAFPYKGTYTINFTITTKNGYSAKASQTFYSPGNVTGFLYLDTVPCTNEVTLNFAQNEGVGKRTGIKWSTGDTSRSIIIKNTGTYYCNLVNDCGYTYLTLPYTISSAPQPFDPTLKVSGNKVAVASPSDTYLYKWYRNGVELADIGSAIYPLNDGYYAVEVTNRYGCKARDTILWMLIYDATATFTNVTPVISCDSSKWKFKADFDYYKRADSLISWKFDYGDGTSGTDSVHQYSAPGTYQAVVNLRTYNSMGASDTVTVRVRSPYIVTAEAVYSIKDTIVAHPPVDYDPSSFTVNWSKDGVALPATTWFIIPDGAGTYTVSVASQYGCRYSAVVTYAPPAKATIVPPAAGAEDLDVSADFGNTTFNNDNEFTVELTIKDPGGRTLTDNEVIILGTIKSTDPSSLSVAIPDALACASNYTVRVVSSSPADTTTWSGTFTIINQPPQPVITQAGDSLFTSSSYDLQWYKDDVAISGATNAAIRARANGAYKVAALNGESCTSISDARSVVITAVTNVSLGSNTVSAYPNPSDGPVYLKFGYPLSEKVQVKVYNIQGVLVYSTTTIQQQQLLDLSTQSKGFYMVEVTGYGAKKVLTIVLQ
ncbi:PKD domain-containing protein [Chitinophaga sp.]|uniref:PKD domain-containing protein n=1 Tax=Chitinophaga sp. TaxID=1869181 RepID=UPI0031DF6183